MKKIRKRRIVDYSNGTYALENTILKNGTYVSEDTTKKPSDRQKRLTFESDTTLPKTSIDFNGTCTPDNITSMAPDSNKKMTPEKDITQSVKEICDSSNPENTKSATYVEESDKPKITENVSNNENKNLNNMMKQQKQLDLKITDVQKTNGTSDQENNFQERKFSTTSISSKKNRRKIKNLRYSYLKFINGDDDFFEELTVLQKEILWQYHCGKTLSEVARTLRRDKSNLHRITQFLVEGCHYLFPKRKNRKIIYQVHPIIREKLYNWRNCKSCAETDRYRAAPDTSSRGQSCAGMRRSQSRVSPCWQTHKVIAVYSQHGFENTVWTSLSTVKKGLVKDYVAGCAGWRGLIFDYRGLRFNVKTNKVEVSSINPIQVEGEGDADCKARVYEIVENIVKDFVKNVRAEISRYVDLRFEKWKYNFHFAKVGDPLVLAMATNGGSREIANGISIDNSPEVGTLEYVAGNRVGEILRQVDAIKGENDLKKSITIIEKYDDIEKRVSYLEKIQVDLGSMVMNGFKNLENLIMNLSSEKEIKEILRLLLNRVEYLERKLQMYESGLQDKSRDTMYG